jgi:hypothetical protein
MGISLADTRVAKGLSLPIRGATLGVVSAVITIRVFWIGAPLHRSDRIVIVCTTRRAEDPSIASTCRACRIVAWYVNTFAGKFGPRVRCTASRTQGPRQRRTPWPSNAGAVECAPKDSITEAILAPNIVRLITQPISGRTRRIVYAIILHPKGAAERIRVARQAHGIAPIHGIVAGISKRLPCLAHQRIHAQELSRRWVVVAIDRVARWNSPELPAGHVRCGMPTTEGGPWGLSTVCERRSIRFHLAIMPWT